MSLGPLNVLLGEVSVQVFCPFFNRQTHNLLMCRTTLQPTEPSARAKLILFFNDGHVCVLVLTSVSVPINIAFTNLDLIYKLANVSGFVSQCSLAFIFSLSISSVGSSVKSYSLLQLLKHWAA